MFVIRPTTIQPRPDTAMTTTTTTATTTTTTPADERELLEALAGLAERFGYTRILDVLADGAECAWDAATTPAEGHALSAVAELLRRAQSAAHRVEASAPTITPAAGLEVLADSSAEATA